MAVLLICKNCNAIKKFIVENLPNSGKSKERKIKMGQCTNCGKELKRGKLYCSNECQRQYEYHQYISEWISGKQTGLRGKHQISSHVRTYLLEIHNNKCENCGWGEENQFTKTVPLEIHHIDGNPYNNSVNNLQLLCPNCHSLTKNWKGSNKNSLREYRKKSFPIQDNPEQE